MKKSKDILNKNDIDDLMNFINNELNQQKRVDKKERKNLFHGYTKKNWNFKKYCHKYGIQ